MADVTNDIFQDVMAGLEKVRAHLKGEPVPGMVLHEPGARVKRTDRTTEGDADAEDRPQTGSGTE